MAVPTIASVSPAIGPADGHVLVEILGTNFRQQATPPATGPAPAPPPSVRVLFGGTPARRVRVMSATRLLVTPPAGDPDLSVASDVVVQNIGSLGEIIGSEVATAAAAWRWARPVLTEQGEVQRVARMLIRSLKASVLPEVVLTQHVDWSEDPADLLRRIAVARLPAVFLSGPTLSENKLYRTAVAPSVPIEGGALEYRTPRTVDLGFGIGALSENPMELLGIVDALVRWQNGTPWLLDEANAAIRWDLDWEQDLATDSIASESSVLIASGAISVRGVDLLGSAGRTRDLLVDEHPAASGGVDLGTGGMT